MKGTMMIQVTVALTVMLMCALTSRAIQPMSVPERLLEEIEVDSILSSEGPEVTTTAPPTENFIADDGPDDATDYIDKQPGESGDSIDRKFEDVTTTAASTTPASTTAASTTTTVSSTTASSTTASSTTAGPFDQIPFEDRLAYTPRTVLYELTVRENRLEQNLPLRSRRWEHDASSDYPRERELFVLLAKLSKFKPPANSDTTVIFFLESKKALIDNIVRSLHSDELSVHSDEVVKLATDFMKKHTFKADLTKKSTYFSPNNSASCKGLYPPTNSVERKTSFCVQNYIEERVAIFRDKGPYHQSYRSTEMPVYIRSLPDMTESVTGKVITANFLSSILFFDAINVLGTPKILYAYMVPSGTMQTGGCVSTLLLLLLIHS